MNSNHHSAHSLRILPTEKYFALIRQILSSNGRAYVRVTGISMQPLLRNLRDGVILIPPKKIRTGDIVLYDRHNGRYALHRVIRKYENGFTMAGDNQWYLEENLSYDQIVGVAEGIDRGGQRISCENWLIRGYSFAMVILALPRMHVHQLYKKVMHQVRKTVRRFECGEEKEHR